jgi:hypothetical protein
MSILSVTLCLLEMDPEEKERLLKEIKSLKEEIASMKSSSLLGDHQPKDIVRKCGCKGRCCMCSWVVLPPKEILLNPLFEGFNGVSISQDSNLVSLPPLPPLPPSPPSPPYLLPSPPSSPPLPPPSLPPFFFSRGQHKAG